MVSKKDLLNECSKLGIKVATSTKREKLLELIQEREKINHIDLGNAPKVTHIYHIADIHIRHLDRHLEYTKIFEQLYGIIENDCENSIMVIAGDIFHSRDNITSELILLFDNFVKKISSFMPVFMILGNHDCFNNSGRVDVLSGIMHISNYTNVFLLKNSGIYEYSNIIFGVSSCLDGKFITCPETAKTCIGLFHGIVNGSTMDSGITCTSNTGISKFKGYSLVLLGDVHKRQFLDKEKTIAYPGSLIQQNFKEERRHGFLKWNLDDKTSEFVCLENEYSFIDLSLDIDLDSINFSKYSRIRLVLDPDQLEHDIKAFTERVANYTTIVSIKNYLKETPVIKTENDTRNESTSIDIREQDIIKDLSGEIDPDSLFELHQNLLDKIEDSDLSYSQSISWCITEMHFKNIFSYGNDKLNVIKFNDGVTGILAGNASGKTNIMNTIIYGLFGNIYKNQNNRNIISRYSKTQELFVKLIIKFQSGETFVLERSAKSRTRNKSHIQLNETTNFYSVQDDGVLSCLNRSTKIDTEKYIKEKLSILGKDEFILTNMMSNISYGANMSILSMSGSQLDEIFNSLFNLNKYKLLHDETKKLIKTTNDQIKVNNTKLDMINTNLSEINIDQVNNKITLYEDNICSDTIKLKDLTKELGKQDSLLLKLQQIDITENSDVISSKINENNEILSEYSGNISDLDEDSIESEFQTCKKLYDSKGYKKLSEISTNTAQTITLTLEELDKKIAFNEGKRQKVEFTSDISNEYYNAKKMLNKLTSEQKDSLNLNFVNGILKDARYSKDDNGYYIPTDEYNAIINEMSKEYFDTTVVLKYKKIIEDKERRDSIIESNIEIDEKINKYKKMQRQKAIQDAVECKNKLNNYAQLLEYIDCYNENIILNEKLQMLIDNKEINDILGRKLEINENINLLNDNIVKLEKELSVLKNNKEMYMKLVKQKQEIIPLINKDSTILNLYKKYLEITHSKNLPKIIISNVIKTICNEANTLIYNTTGLLCEIQENEKWEIIVKKGKSCIGPEHCSGYERFVINTSLKLAFDKYKQLSSIKLFLIDEVIDCVSEDNFDQIDVIFDYLKNYYSKILIISHNEELKKKVNYRINLAIDNKVSSIE